MPTFAYRKTARSKWQMQCLLPGCGDILLVVVEQKGLVKLLLVLRLRSLVSIGCALDIIARKGCWPGIDETGEPGRCCQQSGADELGPR